MFFYVITKNLNWEILTKNLITFKRWDAVKGENFLGGGGCEWLNEKPKTIPSASPKLLNLNQEQPSNHPPHL